MLVNIPFNCSVVITVSDLMALKIARCEKLLLGAFLAVVTTPKPTTLAYSYYSIIAFAAVSSP